MPKLGKKIDKPPVKDIPLETKPETNKVVNNSEIKDIIHSMLTPEIKQAGFYVKPEKRQRGIAGGCIWSKLYKIQNYEIEDEAFDELIYKRYGAGEYRCRFYTQSGKLIPIEGDKTELEFAVGELTPRSPSPINNQPSVVSKTSPLPPTGDPVRDSSEIVAQRIELEKRKIQLEQQKIDRELSATRSNDNGNNRELLQMLMQGFEKLGTIFSSALTSLKPAANDEIKELRAEIKALGDKRESNENMKMVFETMSSTFKMITESSKEQSQATREMIEKNQASIINLIQAQNNQKDKGMNFMEMIKQAMELLEFRDARSPLPQLEEEETQPPSTLDRIGDFLLDLFKKANEQGVLQKLLPARTGAETPTVISEEEIKAQVAKVLAEAGHKKVGTSSEPKPANKEPVPANPDIETEKKSRMNAVLQTLLKEIGICPKACEWITEAYENLPADVLAEIKNSKNEEEFISIVKKHSDPLLLEQIMSYLKPEMIQKLTNAGFVTVKINWLTEGINTLRAMLIEDDKPGASENPPA